MSYKEKICSPHAQFDKHKLVTILLYFDRRLYGQHLVEYFVVGGTMQITDCLLL